MVFDKQKQFSKTVRPRNHLTLLTRHACIDLDGEHNMPKLETIPVGCGSWFKCVCSIRLTAARWSRHALHAYMYGS